MLRKRMILHSISCSSSRDHVKESLKHLRAGSERSSPYIAVTMLRILTNDVTRFCKLDSRRCSIILCCSTDR